MDQFTEYAKPRPIALEDYNARADYIVTYLMPEWIDFGLDGQCTCPEGFKRIESKRHDVFSD